jgi:hypothetical protein
LVNLLAQKCKDIVAKQIAAKGATDNKVLSVDFDAVENSLTEAREATEATTNELDTEATKLANKLEFLPAQDTATWLKDENSIREALSQAETSKEWAHKKRMYVKVTIDGEKKAWPAHLLKLGRRCTLDTKGPGKNVKGDLLKRLNKTFFGTQVHSEYALLPHVACKGGTGVPDARNLREITGKKVQVSSEYFKGAHSHAYLLPFSWYQFVSHDVSFNVSFDAVCSFPTMKIQSKTATTFAVQYKHGVHALEETFTMESMAKDANFTTLALNPGSMARMSEMEDQELNPGFDYSKKRLQVLLNLGKSKTGLRKLRDLQNLAERKTRDDDLQATGNIYEVQLYNKSELDQTAVQGNLVTVNAGSEPMRRLEEDSFEGKVGKVVGYVQRYVAVNSRFSDEFVAILIQRRMLRNTFPPQDKRRIQGRSSQCDLPS